MPTYVYETIPARRGKKPRRFEIMQRMSDAPLAADPQTGEPVRRVQAGGLGIIVGSKTPDTRCGSDCGVPGSGMRSCCGGSCALDR